jgi:hypothetical protein
VFPVLADRLDPLVLVVGATAIGVGLLLPVAETVWRSGGARVGDRIALVRLRRLWLDLTEAMPEVVLGARPTLWADVCGRDVSFRLYRRVIEIRYVGLAARVGEAAPALEPDRVEALLAGLAATDRRNAETAQAVRLGRMSPASCGRCLSWLAHGNRHVGTGPV